MAHKVGTLGYVVGWSARVLGYARDGQLVFERVPNTDGKRYTTGETNFHAQILHEDNPNEEEE